MTRKERIEAALTAALGPTHLDVVNESSMHAVAPGAETHFRVTVVSSAFEGTSAVRRHQLVYSALKSELENKPKLHALAITSKTPNEWTSAPAAGLSPACMGLGGTKE